MGILKTTALLGGLGVTGYAGLEAMKQGGVVEAGKVQHIVDRTAGSIVNILKQVGVHIGDLAPISQKFIDELSGVFTQSSLGELGVAGVLGAGAYWIGKKSTQITGKILGVDSDSDNSIVGTGLAAGTVLGTLGANGIGVTAVASTTGYVLGKKLGEKILGEKYAKITGGITSLATTGLAWGIEPGVAIGGAVVVGSAAGIGKIIWNTGEVSRERNRQKRAAKKNK